jgi:hypothetical protein
MKKEFRINKLISLRLVDNKTILYIKDREFKQCKILLLNVPASEVVSSQDIKSMDEAAERLDSSMMESIDPEMEFWGHCSNIQAWVENNYDTDFLHRTLAFPLLKILSEEGDKLARQKFKEEIARRYKYGNYTVQAFLFEEGYTSYLSRDDILTGILTPEDAIFMEKVMRHKRYSLIPCFDLRRDVEGSNRLFMSIKNGRIKELELEMSFIPHEIEKLTHLNQLILYIIDHCDNLFREPFSSESIRVLKIDCYTSIALPDSLYYFPNLMKLQIRGLEGSKPALSIEKSFIKMVDLEYLHLSCVNLVALPNTIVNLKKLKSLELVDLPIKEFSMSIMETLEGMDSLEWLTLTGIKLPENQVRELECKISHLNYWDYEV